MRLATVIFCLAYSKLLMMVLSPLNSQPKGNCYLYTQESGVGVSLRYPLTTTEPAEVSRGPCMLSHYICLLWAISMCIQVCACMCACVSACVRVVPVGAEAECVGYTER